METQSCFRDYNPDQLMLFPADLKQWLPEDDLVYFLTDVVDELDLEPIYASRPHRAIDDRGLSPLKTYGLVDRSIRLRSSL